MIALLAACTTIKGLDKDQFNSKSFWNFRNLSFVDVVLSVRRPAFQNESVCPLRYSFSATNDKAKDDLNDNTLDTSRCPECLGAWYVDGQVEPTPDYDNAEGCRLSEDIDLPAFGQVGDFFFGIAVPDGAWDMSDRSCLDSPLVPRVTAYANATKFGLEGKFALIAFNAYTYSDCILVGKLTIAVPPEYLLDETSQAPAMIGNTTFSGITPQYLGSGQGRTADQTELYSAGHVVLTSDSQ